MVQKEFTIILDKFYQGYSPSAFSNSLTKFGNGGNASVMTNADVLSTDYLTQGPALTTLTDGTSAVTELISFIMDTATADSVSWAIGATKLFKLSPTVVTSGTTITSCADGESLISMGGNLYGFYNTSGAGDILKMPLSTEVKDDDWGSTTPGGAAALQKAPHPSATKEDIIVYGNGRYLGTYIGGTNTLSPTKLDFGIGNEMSDVCFHANQWWIAVNSGVTGTNRNQGRILVWDGGALETILSDETSVGPQRIGWIMPINGIMYVAYQDLSATDGYKIGYIAGRQIKELASYSGSLPNFAQKTLYNGTILFMANNKLYSCGAIKDILPIQISQIASVGYTTGGALGSPFGTPMVSSTQSTSYKIAKFATTYDTTSTWKSIVIPTTDGEFVGYIDKVIVFTNILGANAGATLKLETNQGVNVSTGYTIGTTGKIKHIFNVNISNANDVRAFIDWSSGNATNPCKIEKIIIKGHFTEQI